MTPVALDMSQIHLGKGQGASGRHQECLHSLLENRRVVSAWVYIVQWRTQIRDGAITDITSNHLILWSSLTSITQLAGGNIKSCKLCRWLLNKQLLVTRPCRVQVAMAPVSLWALNFVICWKPSQAWLTSAGSGPEEVCPGSGSGHILEIQQESEPTFSLNCVYTVYNGANYTEIHSHNTSVLTHKYHLASMNKSWLVLNFIGFF